MPEVTFNPDTGSGEFVQRGGSQPEPQSLQERADIQQAVSFRNTSQHLSDRARQKEGSDLTQVGGGNIEAEIRLQETQRELSDMVSGKIPHNALRMLQLESLQNTLASHLVGGESGANASLEDAPEQWTEKDLKTDLEEGLASDPKTQETIKWSAETFSNDNNSLFNEILDHSANAETTQQFVATLGEIKKNPDSFNTSEVVSDLSPTTIQHIETEFGADLARDISTLTAAVANGVCTRQEAILNAVRNPKLAGAMLQLAQDPNVDFTLSL